MTLSHFGAGTETIGLTLSAVLCNIIQQQSLQVKLQKEIDIQFRRVEKNQRDGMYVWSEAERRENPLV
jgi:hypothetical protein